MRGKTSAAAEIADHDEYGNHLPPPALRKVPQWNTPSFIVEKMTELLDHDNHQMRKDFRKFVSDPGTVHLMKTNRVNAQHHILKSAQASTR